MPDRLTPHEQLVREVARLRRDFPTVSPSRLRAVLIAEWEASTGGWPIVVPADVEVGAHETLLRAR